MNIGSGSILTYSTSDTSISIRIDTNRFNPGIAGHPRSRWIKSQIQGGPEANVNKRVQLLLRSACLFFGNGNVSLLPRFSHKQAQPKTGV